MRNTVAIFSLMILTLAYAGAASAKSYRVEVLVFGQHSKSVEHAGQSDSAIDWPENFSEITTPAVANQDSVILAPLTLLTRVSATLAKQKQYPVLFQSAWQQSTGPNQGTPSVHISNAQNNLEGFVRVNTANNALTLSLDLEFSPLANANSKNTVVNSLYHIQESRNVPLNELHYFDHPNFGVIAVVSPVQ